MNLPPRWSFKLTMTAWRDRRVATALLLLSGLVTAARGSDAMPAIPAPPTVPVDVVTMAPVGRWWIVDDDDPWPLVESWTHAGHWTPDGQGVLYARSRPDASGLHIYMAFRYPREGNNVHLLLAAPTAGTPTRLIALDHGRVAVFGTNGLSLVDDPGTPTARLRVIADKESQPLASPDGRWLAFLQSQDGAIEGDPCLLGPDGAIHRLSLPAPAVNQQRVTWLMSWDADGRLSLVTGTCGRGQPRELAAHDPWVLDPGDLSCRPRNQFNRPLHPGEQVGGPDLRWPLRWILPGGRVLSAAALDRPQPQLHPPIPNGPESQPATKLRTWQIDGGGYDVAGKGITIAINDQADHGDLMPMAVSADGHWLLAGVFHTWYALRGAPSGGWRPAIERHVLCDLLGGRIQPLPSLPPLGWPERAAVLVFSAAAEVLVVDPHPTLSVPSQHPNLDHGIWSYPFSGAARELAAAAGLGWTWDANDLTAFRQGAPDRLALIAHAGKAGNAKHELLVFMDQAMPLTAMTADSDAAAPRTPEWNPDGYALTFTTADKVAIWVSPQGDNSQTIGVSKRPRSAPSPKPLSAAPSQPSPATPTAPPGQRDF